jgi:hypothetical protein
MQVVDANGNMFGYDHLEIIGADGKPKTTGGGGGGVTSVTATLPLLSSGGSTPDISIFQASAAASGYLSATDWLTFNGKQAALVSGGNIKTLNSNSLLGSGNIAVEPTITAGTTAQYWRGDKTWQPFPSLTGFVPYTGATTNVDLGTHTLSAKDLIRLQ